MDGWNPLSFTIVGSIKNGDNLPSSGEAEKGL